MRRDAWRQPIWRSQAGSFTLEASLAFPILLLAVFVLLAFSYMLFNRTDLYVMASQTADRASYVWDNSAKDMETGAYPPGQRDSLYWRSSSDSVSDMFSFLVRNEATRLHLPLSDSGLPGSVPLKKLQKAATILPSGVKGELSYSNKLYSRQVEAIFERKPILPIASEGWFAPSHAVAVKSGVIEPVELIRTVDLARTFAGRLKDLLTGRKQALPVSDPLPEWTDRQVKLTSEKEAAAYLRSLLGNTASIDIKTPSGQLRKLDALDPDGLFHEAKFGYISKSEAVERQLAKDLELLETAGPIKGVVWHFFRDSRNGKLGPSKPLRKELEKRGILVIIHS
ncbi:hypothetical protein [Paenibacillus koleovorans]|uniref:hypothetical protein n=1 Tax=Paenibacillus koleovorans TaxID=121608 RepID=UPI000FD84717|nr:hypothetical protein [Paenibacillus koleovorans]